jgi:hypothetical protein
MPVISLYLTSLRRQWKTCTCYNIDLTMLFVLIAAILIDHIRAQSIPSLRLDPCSSSCHDSRTIWNIVWSSLVTLFACIWVAVHPNVPAFTDGTVTKLKQRAKLLLPAVIAPEIIIMFAMRQWLCARQVKQSVFGKGEDFVFLS